jgi:hypothetical protein
MLSIKPYPVTRNPFFAGGVNPQLEGVLLLKVYEQQSLWMGGTSEFCVQLVTFHQI